MGRDLSADQQEDDPAPAQEEGNNPPSQSDFSILYLNANSLINKIDELRYTLFDNKPDIICVCETWSHDQTLNAFFKYKRIQYNL